MIFCFTITKKIDLVKIGSKRIKIWLMATESSFFLDIWHKVRIINRRALTSRVSQIQPNTPFMRKMNFQDLKSESGVPLRKTVCLIASETWPKRFNWASFHLCWKWQFMDHSMRWRHLNSIEVYINEQGLNTLKVTVCNQLMLIILGPFESWIFNYKRCEFVSQWTPMFSYVPSPPVSSNSINLNQVQKLVSWEHWQKFKVNRISTKDGV